MELFDNLALGLATAASWQNLLFCFAGVMIGTLVGVLPGISPLTTVAMLLPFTFGLSPVVGPVTDLNRRPVRLVRTSLTDPGDGAPKVETGDGPLWIVEAEPLD